MCTINQYSTMLLKHGKQFSYQIHLRTCRRAFIITTVIDIPFFFCCFLHYHKSVFWFVSNIYSIHFTLFFFHQTAKLSYGIWLFTEIGYWNGKPTNWRSIKGIDQVIAEICQYTGHRFDWWKNDFVDETATMWPTGWSECTRFLCNESIETTYSTLCDSRAKMDKHQSHMEVCKIGLNSCFLFLPIRMVLFGAEIGSRWTHKLLALTDITECVSGTMYHS